MLFSSYFDKWNFEVKDKTQQKLLGFIFDICNLKLEFNAIANSKSSK
jgi:hypothetical protein